MQDEERYATFPINLRFATLPHTFIESVAAAVRAEHQDASHWQRLRCRKVTPVTGAHQTLLYALEVGHAIELDWTWEGAIAFRPTLLDGAAVTPTILDDFLSGAADMGQAAESWLGELVEVDEDAGVLYVAVSDTEHPPQVGTFYVRPFEFLAALHTIYANPAFVAYQELLNSRLYAACGHLTPESTMHAPAGLPELQQLWQQRWSTLWGVPGAGKTTLIGQQVGACLLTDQERILVVSTTNRATDEVALKIGKAATTTALRDGRVLRIGKSVNYTLYEEAGLEALLRGTEADLLREIANLNAQLGQCSDHAERATIRTLIQILIHHVKDNAFSIFLAEQVQVVIGTAYKALHLLSHPTVKAMIEEGQAPFTTLIIDEASLLSRAYVAALSLLAAQRVVLAGDPKQLAPISRMSRILPTHQANWLAHSGLSHLQISAATAYAHIHLLTVQHRMHPQIRQALSAYQYGGVMQDGPGVIQRKALAPALLAEQPRTLWYVIDEEDGEHPAIRAERGPGNRSWVRAKTRDILDKLFTDPQLLQSNGLFITPFKAQARAIGDYLAQLGSEQWRAATVHSQQGVEADIIIFDTVNAGSYSWPLEEWQRLITVAISRAREFVILIASRAEMNEPYLRPLAEHFAPRILVGKGTQLTWREVPSQRTYTPALPLPDNPHLLGHQLTLRKALTKVLSTEQQRLVRLQLDGKPRLIRGVAGSGKTVVLAHWLQQMMVKVQATEEMRVWIVYANRALQGLLTDQIEQIYNDSGQPPHQPPWDQVTILHIRDILAGLLPEVGLQLQRDQFDYDACAAAYLARKPLAQITPRCQAMFVDEAQDLGATTLQLLTALVEQSDPADAKSRAIHIFYDNAQNVYGRSTPKWSEIGLDLRGRSTVMKESFRSTRPIAEFALNVLYNLAPPVGDADHQELVARGLIEQVMQQDESQGNKPWWKIRFNQIEGPAPYFKNFCSPEQEYRALGRQLVKLIQQDAVKPSDICILYNGRPSRERIVRRLTPLLRPLGVRLSVQSGRTFHREEDTILVTTAHSFKGYDAEIVFVVGAEQFVAHTQDGAPQILAAVLYVAMTRARSLLAIYACAQPAMPLGQQIVTVMEACTTQMHDQHAAVMQPSPLDEFTDLLDLIGHEHQDWLARLWKRAPLIQEPLFRQDGTLLAEPLFWLEDETGRAACFGPAAPDPATAVQLAAAGIRLLLPGAA